MQAAAMHLRHAAQWRGDTLNQETLDVLNSSNSIADSLLSDEDLPSNRVGQVVEQLKGRVEHFTGRKLELAPPMLDSDPMAPSLFQ